MGSFDCKPISFLLNSVKDKYAVMSSGASSWVTSLRYVTTYLKYIVFSK